MAIQLKLTPGIRAAWSFTLIHFTTFISNQCVVHNLKNQSPVWNRHCRCTGKLLYTKKNMYKLPVLLWILKLNDYGNSSVVVNIHSCNGNTFRHTKAKVCNGYFQPTCTNQQLTHKSPLQLLLTTEILPFIQNIQKLAICWRNTTITRNTSYIHIDARL